MTDLVEDCRSERSLHASFVVRCWVGASGQVRVRLIDADTGVVYPLVDLSHLAARIHWLLRGHAAAEDNSDRL